MNFVFVGQNVLGGRALDGMLARGLRPQLVVTRPRNNYHNLVEDISKDNNLCLASTFNINQDRQLISRIKNLNPSVIFCCSWGQRIGASLLSLPPRGWVNFHPSYLPAYRGPCPIEWQLIDGIDTGGGSAHFMTLEFDAGPIITQRRMPISPNDNSETMRHKCGSVLGELAAECYQLLLADPDLAGTPQDEACASYDGPPEYPRTSGRGIAAFIHWIRGLSPYRAFGVLKSRASDRHHHKGS
jgi:methionyl-tRNA formyltransferase